VQTWASAESLVIAIASAMAAVRAAEKAVMIPGNEEGARTE
jgi:hypothetical protein